jgi:hypothetical protein
MAGAQKRSRRKASPRQMAARRKFVRMVRARAKAGRKGSTLHRGRHMAVKRKRRAATTRRRRRSRPRAGVRLVRRGVAVYQGNPHRRRRRRGVGRITSRRRGHRSNPPILAALKQTAMDTVLVLAGGAAQRTVNNFVPAIANQYAEAAKGLAIATVLRLAAGKFLGADRARFIGAGAMQLPIKNLIVSLAPPAAGFLGDYEISTGINPLGDAYPDGGYLAGEEDTMGDYSPAQEVMGSYEIM